MNNKTLPDAPSALIRLALKDLEICELDEGYVIDMGTWMVKRGDVCEVCLAGAVMARTLEQVPETFTLYPYEMTDRFDSSVAKKLRALDMFRRGAVENALSELRIPHPPGLIDWFEVGDYHQNAARFKKEITALADMLEGYGL